MISGEFWVLVRNGLIVPLGLRMYKKSMIEYAEYLFNRKWAVLKKDGYSCVKVEMRDLKP